MKPHSDSPAVDSPALSAPPQRDRWDTLLILAIFAGIGTLAYAALATPLLQPLVDVARRASIGACCGCARRSSGSAWGSRCSACAPFSG